MAIFSSTSHPLPQPTPAESTPSEPTTPPVNPNMAICRDCEGAVSRHAEVCPHCGRRIKLSRTDVLLTVLFVLALIGLLVECLQAVGGKRY